MVMTVYEWRWWVRWDMIPEMARRELCKPDANTVSICSLYTIEKRFSGNRESCPFWFRSREFAAKREFRSLFDAVRIGFGGYGRQNQGFLLCFCLLRWPRGAFLDSAVEHFSFFSCFCSTFSSARIGLAEDMRPRGTAMHGKWCFGTHGHSFLAVVQLHPTRSHQSPAFYPKGARMPPLL